MPIMVKVSGGKSAGSLGSKIIPIDDRRLDFRSLSGSREVKWNLAGPRSLSVLDKTLGLDVPPREVIRDRVPGLEGSRIRLIRTGEREVFLPLLVRSPDGDWRWVLDKLAEIRALQDYRQVDYVNEDGTFDLVARARGAERRLRVSYLDGMEGDYGQDTSLPELRIFPLRLLATDPYWYGEPWSTNQVTLPAPAPFLSNDPGDAFPRAITASVALGSDMPLVIPGDVPSPASIELVGPATETVITSPAGLNVTIGEIADGDTFRLDTGRRKSATVNGVDAWELVGASPQWRALPPGETTISVQVTGATEGTSARVFGSSLWETAW